MITTLGPSGTYSEIAAHKLFPNEKIILKDSFFEIFAHHKAGDTMVLPIENSSNGSVIPVWEAIAQKDLFISQTLKMPIVHALGAQSGSFTHIFGHPQAIGQCSNFLHNNFPNVKIESANSTGEAIEKATINSNYAAIGDCDVMLSRDLKVIHQAINDATNNVTVFGVIADHDLYPENKKTTSIILVTPKTDKHGLLLNILQTIEAQAINMSRLESRPQGTNLGHYKFFIDLQTSPHSQEFQKIITELNKEHEVKLLGAY